MNYTFSVTDGTHVLSTITVDETLVAGTNNAISGVALQGVLGSVNLGGVGALTAGTPKKGAVGVTVDDPDGAPITGNTTPFSGSSVTLTSSSSHFKLALGGGTPGASVVITDAPTITGLNGPVGVAVDAAGKIYVANADNNTVTTYNADGSASTPTITGLSEPSGIAVH